MFNTLSDRITGSFKSLRSKGRLSASDVEETISQIRRALLDADVALPVVRSFTAAVREKATGAVASKALNPGQQVVKIVNDELVEILGGETRELDLSRRPAVIMLAGLQGAGKTTLAGKLGRWLKSEKHSPLLVACDLQRPNAVNQLQIVGERAGVHVFAPEPGNGVGDPVQVARKALEHAERSLYDVVVIDTAGRLGIDEVLMQQAADIKATTRPDEVLFVVDATVGTLDEDEAVVKVLRRSRKPVVLAANKVDDQRHEAMAATMWNLGLGEPYPVSAMHGRGSGDLLDAVLAVLPEAPR